MDALLMLISLMLCISVQVNIICRLVSRIMIFLHPSTLETVDFSNICYRMVCRNAISSADLADYGRDLGVMAYGDLFKSKDQKFSYLSYQLSLTNGYL